MEDKRAFELSDHHKLSNYFHTRSRIILTYSPTAFFHNISPVRSQHVKWTTVNTNFFKILRFFSQSLRRQKKQRTYHP